jgi:hypothetical protein
VSKRGKMLKSCASIRRKISKCLHAITRLDSNTT